MSDELDQAFAQFRAAKNFADQANAALGDAEQRLLKVMEREQRKSLNVSADGHTFSATYTRRKQIKINEIGLRRALTARVFDKYTVKKLDRRKLEEAMEQGLVDPQVVARFVDLSPGKAYVTYRMKEDRDEAEGREFFRGEEPDQGLARYAHSE